MSDAEQGDLLAELREGGLIDDETDAPQLTTAEPEDTEPEAEQLELQPAAADGRVWRGAEQLRPYLVRIPDLKPTPGNPDKGKTHVGRLKGSLERFGQTRAILADASDGVTIRAGHHLTRAAEEMGWTHIAVIQAEFNDEGEAIAYLMADNQLARVGDEGADKDRQLELIDLIGETNLEGTGWELDAVENLRAEVGQVAVVAETEPWGGEAAESGEEAAARAAALAGYEPHKEIPLYMTLPQHELFSEHVRLLQNAWGIKGVMDTILRALEECYNREAAPVGEAAPDEAAAPETPAEGATMTEEQLVGLGVTPEAAAAAPPIPVDADAVIMDGEGNVVGYHPLGSEELVAEPVAAGSPDGGEEGDGTPESATATPGPDDDIPA